jgi:U6 snRNA-associated Sm-like protein LSm6
MATTTSSSSTPTRNTYNQRKPAEFLRGVTGRPIIVKLNSGVEYRGILACVDGFFNVALEQTEEYVGGIKKAQLGDAFIRGNNVLFISKQD